RPCCPGGPGGPFGGRPCGPGGPCGGGPCGGGPCGGCPPGGTPCPGHGCCGRPPSPAGVFGSLFCIDEPFSYRRHGVRTVVRVRIIRTHTLAGTCGEGPAQIGRASCRESGEHRTDR